MLLESVNSNAAFLFPQPRYRAAVNKEKPKLIADAQESPENEQEALALKALFDKYRAQGGLTQEAFAEAFGLKSQSNAGHYLHGRRPLNLPAATSFARGLKVDIDAFSPSVVQQVLEAKPYIAALKTGARWPLQDQSLVPEIERLTKDQKLELQGAIASMLIRFQLGGEQSSAA